MKNLPQEILIKDYTYDLPHHRIAEFPLEQRDQSKLLVYKGGNITDDAFSNIPHLLPEGVTLILNDTRVIEARLFFQKPTGGVIEIFCLEPYQQSIEQAMQQKSPTIWKCLIGGASKWKHGQILEKHFHQNERSLTATYIDKMEDYFLIEFNWNPSDLPFVQILHEAGAIPLPPYIKRSAEKVDWERYQTIFGRQEGSVAAPTAALHFTRKTFEQLKEKGADIGYVTLHVGAGTFKPVKAETIAEHHMHSEPFTVKKDVLQKLSASEKIIAVGTTSLRTLESLHWIGLKLRERSDESFSLQQWEAYELAEHHNSVTYQQSLQSLIQWMEEHSTNEIHCKTSLIIVPGYEFRSAAGLITNFHQPNSTLLLLVAAFIGEDWRKVYQHALDNNYRFLSYGDSNLLWRV
jgi:S-adenosylmethionine:tRNA ribosyltransferase-isomerase